jgi:hypothetical protein
VWPVALKLGPGACHVGLQIYFVIGDVIPDLEVPGFTTRLVIDPDSGAMVRVNIVIRHRPPPTATAPSSQYAVAFTAAYSTHSKLGCAK